MPPNPVSFFFLRKSKNQRLSLKKKFTDLFLQLHLTCSPTCVLLPSQMYLFAIPRKTLLWPLTFRNLPSAWTLTHNQLLPVKILPISQGSSYLNSESEVVLPSSELQQLAHIVFTMHIIIIILWLLLLLRMCLIASTF